MNLTDFETYKLTLIWQASGHNPEILKAVEDELGTRITNNRSFSREFFYQILRIDKKQPIIYFVPTSESYNIYGPFLSINDILLDAREIQEMNDNLESIPPKLTFGKVKAKAGDVANLSEPEITRLANVGFDTNEVMEFTALK